MKPNPHPLRPQQQHQSASITDSQTSKKFKKLDTIKAQLLNESTPTSDSGGMTNIMSIFQKIREENLRIKEKEESLNSEFEHLQKTDVTIASEKDYIINKKNALRVRENAVTQERTNLETQWKKISRIKDTIKDLENHDLKLKDRTLDIGISDMEKNGQQQIAE
jgi:hypothetical protein